MVFNEFCHVVVNIHGSALFKRLLVVASRNLLAGSGAGIFHSLIPVILVVQAVCGKLVEVLVAKTLLGFMDELPGCKFPVVQVVT